jgi:DNA-binding SARP family transcriptional activator/predicted ATPase
MERDRTPTAFATGSRAVAQLTISLLGSLQIERGNKPVAAQMYAKVLALLVFLAVESDRPHQRSALATLLWPDQSEERARHSLRQALSTLRRAVDAGATRPAIVVSRNTVAFNRDAGLAVDAIELVTLLDVCDRHDHGDAATCASCAGRRERAVALYRGELVEGFTIPDSDVFEDWVQVWRQRFRERVVTALEALADWHERQGHRDQATVAVRRQLELDPWREPAHRRLMELLWQDGNRAAALAQYERCRELLEEELGVDPEPETIALYERIRDGAARTGPAAEERAGTARPLPAPATRLVGRERELEEIADLLGQRGCRLLTLVGPGGIGKTRLALQVAHDRAGRRGEIVGVVSLTSVRDAEGVCSAMAETLGLSLHSSRPSVPQLTEWLSDREVFLVMDNAEHLAPRLGMLAELLAAAPGLTLIVTTRERLQLAAEWVYEVRGMSAPASEDSDAFEGYDAVDLLTERIRQVRPGAPLRHDERPDVIRICRLASGFPLALELAAAWAATLPLARIASEIQENHDFLVATARDTPDRHASMRAVFTSSWDMLTPEEQSAWRRLTVFTDSFDLDAAREVTGTDLVTLAAVMNKSLLARTTSDRYVLHELLRQYGDDLLRGAPDEHREIRDRHAHHYLGRLAAMEEALTGRDQPLALATIEDMFGNIRTAWSWAVSSGMIDALTAAAHALWLYLVTRGRMGEGAVTFGKMLDSLEHKDHDGDGCRRALAIARVYTGGFRSGLGQYDEGIALLRDGIADLRERSTGRDLGLALNMLAAALSMKGRYEEVRDCLQESLAQSEGAGDQWTTAFALNDLGMLLHQRFDDDEAWRHCERSRAIFRRIGDARGQALAAHNLGVIALERGAHRRAMSFHREAMTLRSESNDPWGVATSLVQIGVVSGAMGADADARRELTRALRIAWESSIVPVVLEALVELTALGIDAGKVDGGEPTLSALAAHPVLPDHLRPRLEGMMIAAGIEPVWAEPEMEANRWATQAVDRLARQAMAIEVAA